MKGSKQLISLLLVLLMTLSVFHIVPLTASAAQADAAAQGEDIPEIKLGETKTITIENEGDRVRFRFVPERDMRIRFYSTSALDTVGEINGWYETDDLVEVAERDDDSGEGHNFEIVCEVHAGQSSYTLEAGTYSGVGSFDITVEEYKDVWSTANIDYDGEEAAKITGYDGSDTVLTIPSELNGKPVKKIGYGVFDGAPIEKVIIPDTVEVIADNAFYNCTALKEVVFGHNLRSIEWNAFANTSLVSVEIPASVTEVNPVAFNGCNDLKHITVSPDNETYDSRDNCNAIIRTSSDTLVAGCTATVIPDTVKRIGIYAFGYLDTLTTVTIPDSVTSIESHAFEACGLTSVTIPDSVTSIESAVFSGNQQLKTLKLGSAVKTIGRSSFGDCDALTEVVIPDSVIAIGVEAFYHCEGLKKLTMGASVKAIGDWAFMECYNLRSVTLPPTISRIGEQALGYIIDDNWDHVPMSGFTVTGYTGSVAQTYAADNGFSFVSLGKVKPEPYPEIKLGETVSVVTFGSDDITYLKFVPKADGIVGFHTSAYARDTWGYWYDAKMKELEFGNCGLNDGIDEGYSDVVCQVKAGETYYLGVKPNTFDLELVDVSLFEKGLYDYDVEYGDSVVITRYNGQEAEVNIPGTIDGKTVVAIGNSAFAYNSHIERVVLSDQIHNVSSYSFEDCENLREVVFPDSVRSIDYHAFMDCPNLTAVTIPESVSWIEDNAFGYRYGYEDYAKVNGFTIRGYAGTEAERYAEENGFTFVAIEIPEYTLKLGERVTAPQGRSVYRFTPDRDMVVYFHAIGTSGAFGKDADGYEDFKRCFMLLAKAGETYTLDVKTSEKVHADFDVVYGGADFALEEIPVTDSIVGRKNSFTYASPLKFADAVPEMDLLYPNMGHSVIATLPMQVIRFTPTKTGWVSLNLENDGVYREEMGLKFSDFNDMYLYPFGEKTARLTAGQAYYVTVYSSESAIKGAAGIPYQVTVKDKQFKKLREGHNTITQAPGSGDDFYEFDCPSGGWWTFSVPQGITTEDINLRYQGGVAGFYFGLNERAQINPLFRDLIFQVAANDTDKTKTFDFEISRFHYPSIELNETKSLGLDFDSQLEYRSDQPRMVEVNAEAALHNGSASLSIFSLAKLRGSIYKELQEGANTLRFFAEPGVTYTLYANGYPEDEETDAVQPEISVTLRDVTAQMETITVGQQKQVTLSEGECGVYRFTPSEDCMILANSTVNSSLYLCAQGRESALLATPYETRSYSCVAGRTYYLYYEPSRFETSSGTLMLSARSIPVGDADGDGEVTVLDASVIQHDIALLRTDVDQELYAYADVDRNKVVDIIDVTFILRAAAGLSIPYHIG